MKDWRVEQWLKKEGVLYEYIVSIQLNSIRGADQSVRNVRPRGLDQDMVYGFWSDLTYDKAEFPALVVFREGDEYRLITGHHRCAAFTAADIQTHDAYVVLTTDPQVIDRLRRTANLIEGGRPAGEENLLNAIHFLENGHSLRDAARLAKIKENRLQDWSLAHRVGLELEAQGVNANDISQYRKRLMHGVHGRFLKEIAFLAKDGRLSQEVFHEYCKKLRDAHDDNTREGLLKEWAALHSSDKERSQSGAITPPGNTIRRLAPLLQKAERFVQESTKDGSLKTLSKSQLKTMSEYARRMIKQLEGFAATLEAQYAQAD